MVIYNQPQTSFLPNGNRTIKGVNCSVNLRPEMTLTSRTKWGIEWEWLTVGSDHNNSRDEEKIAYVFSNLPSAHITDRIKDIATTTDLYKEWVKNRDNNIAMAFTFLEKAGSPMRINDYLINSHKQGIIDEWLRDYLLLATDYFYLLWEMIKVKFEKIIKTLQIDNFTSPLELFTAIITENADGLIKPLLKKHYTHNVNKLDDFNCLSRKQKLNPKEHKKLIKLNQEINSELSLLQTVCHALVSISCKDDWMKAKIEMMNSATYGIRNLEMKAHRNPTLKHHGYYQSVKYSQGKPFKD